MENTALEAFRKYGDTVLRTAYACTGNYSEAEDITQEVFLKLHTGKYNFSDETHLKAWLIRSAINRGKSYHRSLKKKERSSLEEISESELKSEFEEKDHDISREIEELPEKYRSVLYLYYYEEYNIREISEILSKNENTVSSLLQRARKKLKERLEEGNI
ncbi:MAG: RNA polymerase sigma factor [Ruminococcus sp.]|nr:RNA polymerase sigma factor [Ruminococcus sp.]